MSDVAGFDDGFYVSVSQTANTVPQRPESHHHNKSEFVIKIFIVILLIILAGETVFYLFVVPAVSAVKISFSETATLTLDDIKRVAGLTGAEKWLELDARDLSRRLARCPLIAQAKVKKRFPDKVFIEITERTAVAVVFAQQENRSVPMEIDKTGTVFRIGSTENFDRLPVISGLAFANPRVGMKAHKQLMPFFSQLHILQKKKSVLLNEISEIKIEQQKYGGFYLVIYPVQTKIKVLTDSTLNEDALRYMMLILDVVQNLGLNSKIDVLDVRAGTASYRLRGDTDE